MVSVMKGLDVRKSRFAALSLDQDSGEEDGETLWQEVAPTKPRQAPKAAHGGQSQSGQSQGEEGKGLSKNAKKRARKRRNRSTSDQEVSWDLVVSPEPFCFSRESRI